MSFTTHMGKNNILSNADVMSSMAGVVIIGRNEGIRLKRCLESLHSTNTAGIVYVDSGSTDGSCELAHRFEATVVELDVSTPFCAARARNAGYLRMQELNPGMQFVQFVDADCELVPGWLSYAVESIKDRPEIATVAGWLRERNPQVSVYNRLADLEWNGADTGKVDTVGGIFLIRCDAFDSVGGFDPTVSAGEEPELCNRLTHQGWCHVKLDHEMATHDLAMTRFSQWWRRMMRSGYGSLDVGWRFGITKFNRNNRRVIFWTLWSILTLGISILAVTLDSTLLAIISSLLLVLWPVQMFRIACGAKKKGRPWNISAPYAFFISIAFLPQFFGQIRYLADRFGKRSHRLLEYKTPVIPENE